MTNATVEFKGSANLDRLLLTNPQMEKRVTNIVRKVIRQARDDVAQKAEGVPKQDPLKTAHAIRSTVYRAIIGGNVNILPSKKANAPGAIPPVRHRLETETNKKGNHRGGNRMPRGRDTTRMLGYRGFDRVFVLRWLDGGTPKRDNNGIRRVGQIGAKPWFNAAAVPAMNRAGDTFAQLVDKLIAKELKS